MSLAERLATTPAASLSQSTMPVRQTVAHYREALTRLFLLDPLPAWQASMASLKHLLWLRQRLGDRMADAAVLTTGELAYRRPDGIAVIPLALLGP
ncbi:MAG: hypothetical protein LBK59_05520 [Bifidobacteriaceae bacterium]|jgi:predicted AAA+ superfamily ATPase|nr:hypothetical protein [Bifidobacteriaceae bacterium]